MLCGAAYGRLMGLAIVSHGLAEVGNAPKNPHIPPHSSSFPPLKIIAYALISHRKRHQVDEGTYAVLGAASFLAGATRMTVSVCVILLVRTDIRGGI